MEVRTAGIGLGLGVMGLFAFILIYSLEVDSVNRTRVQEEETLSNLEREASNLKGTLKRTSDRLAQLKEWGVRYETAIARIDAANAKREELKKALKTLESEYPRIAEQMAAAIEESRRRGPGTKLAELTLKSGKTLKNLRLEKVTPTELSFSHSEGVARVSWKEAPDVLVARYAMGEPTPEPTEATAAPEAAPAEAGALEEVKIDVTPPAETPKATLVPVLTARIRTLQEQIQIAAKQAQKHRQEAARARAAHARARLIGRISGHSATAQRADAAADKIDAQIAEARALIRRLSKLIAEEEAKSLQ